MNTDPTGRCVISLVYWEVEGSGFYHIDVVMNDCDGPDSMDENNPRHCSRDPSITLTVYEGYPSDLPEPHVSSFERYKDVFLNCFDWDTHFGEDEYGYLKAKSWSYDAKRAEHETLPSADAMIQAMGDEEIARDMDVLTVLSNSEPCSDYKQKMDAFVAQVNGHNERGIIINYNLASRNSNGVAYGLLEAAGIKHPFRWQHRQHAPVYTDTVYYMLNPRPRLQQLCRPGRPCG